MEKLRNQLNKAFFLKKKVLRIQIERGNLLDRIYCKYEQKPEVFVQLIQQDPAWKPFLEEILQDAKTLRSKDPKRLL